MPDWDQLVHSQLGRLAGPPEREAAIVAEIAAHLEDATEDALRAGAGERDAVERALALVPDWARLAHELRKEAGMNQRLRTLWVPGATMAALAMGGLWLLARGGVQPHILWLGGYDGQAVHLYLPWLLLLPLIGATAAFWSRRVGGRRLESTLVAVFPAAAVAAFFVLLFPLGRLLDHEVPLSLQLATGGAFILGWAVVPGIALLVGALPVVFGRSQAKQRAQPA